MPGFPTLLLSAVSALAVVLALVWGIAAALRRSGLGLRLGGQPGGGSPLAVEASLALDPRRRLHLLRCADRRVLLLTGGPQDLLLGWLPPAEAPADPGP
jgi:flagellar protein FliO/FliZ